MTGVTTPLMNGADAAYYGAGPIITATIPLPPPVNALFRNPAARDGKRHGRIKTARYAAWITEAGHVLKLACQAKRINGPYSLALRIGRPDARRRDIGNLEKPVSDLLVSIGAVRDDSDCQRIEMEWSSEHPDVFVMVVPTSAIAPVQRAPAKRSAPLQAAD